MGEITSAAGVVCSSSAGRKPRPGLCSSLLRPLDQHRSPRSSNCHAHNISTTMFGSLERQRNDNKLIQTAQNNSQLTRQTVKKSMRGHCCCPSSIVMIQSQTDMVKVRQTFYLSDVTTIVIAGDGRLSNRHPLSSSNSGQQTT